MFGKPRYNKEKGVALCYSSRIVVTKNYREFRVNSSLRKMTKKGFFENQNAVFKALYLRVCKLKEKWDKTPVRNWSIVRNQMIMHPLTKEVATKYFK